MTVSLCFSSSSPFFSPCFCLFCLLCLFISLSLCRAVCFELMSALFLVQTSPQQATDAIWTQVASRKVFVSSVLISNRILPFQFSGQKSRWSLENRFLVNLWLFVCLFLSSLIITFFLLCLTCFSSHICCGSKANRPFLNIP